MSEDNPYDHLTDDNDDHRWAFGTGFTDPLEGIDTACCSPGPRASSARPRTDLPTSAPSRNFATSDWSNARTRISPSSSDDC